MGGKALKDPVEVLARELFLGCQRTAVKAGEKHEVKVKLLEWDEFSGLRCLVKGEDRVLVELTYDPNADPKVGLRPVAPEVETPAVAATTGYQVDEEPEAPRVVNVQKLYPVRRW